MASSTVFTSNRSQAVRLPKAVAFPEDEHHVDILKIYESKTGSDEESPGRDA